MARRRQVIFWTIVTGFLLLYYLHQHSHVLETISKDGEGLSDKAAEFGGLEKTGLPDSDKYRAAFEASERIIADMKVINSDLDERLARCMSEVSRQQIPQPMSGGEHEDALVLFTTATGAHMNELRELVGSLHNQRKSNVDVHYVVIFGFNMPPRSIKEISLWRNVEFVDASTSILLGQAATDGAVLDESESQSSSLYDSPAALLNAMDFMLRKYRNVAYVRNNVVFLSDQVHAIGDQIQSTGYIFAKDDISGDEGVDKYFSVPLMGFKFDSRPAHLFISLTLQCIRGYHCDRSFVVALQAEQTQMFSNNLATLSSLKLSLSSKDKGLYCYLLLRDDILYAFEWPRESEALKNIHSAGDNDNRIMSDPLDPFPASPSGKIPVGIGMPTISVGLQSWEEVAPIRLFVPSLVKTVTAEERKRFEYWVYIGYDDGDRFFDDSIFRKSINDRLESIVSAQPDLKVNFIFVRFPFSKGWVTYLWNGLFVMAMRQGCHYFYQVNDDLQLNEPDWTTVFVDKLTANDQLGVVGPYDNLQRGRILTQAFVSRKHYFIFGRLYPIDIKDWFSDDWLTEVYRPTNSLFVMEGITATNTNDKGTRYVICDKPKYGEILEQSRNTVQDWLHDIELLKSRKQKLINGQSVTSDDQERLQRELKHGPIYQ